MKVLDLFSGLGGASQAFLDAGHDVLRIENNPLLSEVDNTKIMCIYDFRDWLDEHFVDPETMGSLLASSKFKDIDLIWASPPCDEFSLAYSSKHSKWLREHPNEPYQPNLDLLEACLDIIKMLKPRYHVIENVRGSSKYFTEMIGSEPRQILGNAHFLWGDYPLIDPPSYKSKAEVDKRHSPLRANIRAKIPIEISKALYQAICNQKCIFDWVVIE